MLARLLAAALAAASCACAALPWPSAGARPVAAARAGEPLDLRGAVHVHTEVSHDSRGSLDELIAAAHSAGLAWIALTEHTRRAERLPASGLVEDVILIPGWEVPSAGGSILALGVEDAAGLPREPAALVAEVRRRGGASFVGHFERSTLADPEAFDRAAPDGVELANLHAAARETRLRIVLGELFLPAAFALRPLLQAPVDNLARWARLPRARAIVGGADAHARFRALGPLGGTMDRYRDVLRLLTTHVLASERSAAAVLAALREGRSYVAFEGIEPVERFAYARVAGGWRVRAPREARLALVCAGVEVALAQAQEALLTAGASDAHCHLEAWLGSRLWIATSVVQ